MTASGGARLATANQNEATIVVVASGYPRGLFEFTGPPTVSVTRLQKQVNVQPDWQFVIRLHLPL